MKMNRAIMLQDKPPYKSQIKDKRYKNHDETNSQQLAVYRARHANETELANSIARHCGMEAKGFYVNSASPPTLLIQTGNAVLATQLRHHHQAILDIVNSKKGIDLFSRLKVEVRPIYQKRYSQQARMRKISQSNAALLESLAESSTDLKMKEVLKRLAQHGEKAD